MGRICRARGETAGGDAVTDPEPILLTRRQARLAARLIERWQHTGALSPETADRLRTRYTVAAFDWQGLARIAVITAAVCFVIAVASIFADAWLRALIARYLDDAVVRTASLAVAAIALYAWAWLRRRRHPDKPITTEGLLFLAVVATAGALWSLGEALALADDAHRHLVLAAALAYAGLGIWMPSSLVWVFALLSLGGWMGAATGYASGWGAYYLGMNYPLRFVLFGGALIAASAAFARLPAPRLNRLARPTLAMGLLYLFLALWILSIFGNTGDLLIWQLASPAALLAWSVAFAAAAVAAIGHGLRGDDRMTLGFGLTFLAINLYTKYFEYFWDHLHKALFFAVLGASLWALGALAQRLWRRQAAAGIGPLSDR